MVVAREDEAVTTIAPHLQPGLVDRRVRGPGSAGRVDRRRRGVRHRGRQRRVRADGGDRRGDDHDRIGTYVANAYATLQAEAFAALNSMSCPADGSRRHRCRQPPRQRMGLRPRLVEADGQDARLPRRRRRDADGEGPGGDEIGGPIHHAVPLRAPPAAASLHRGGRRAADDRFAVPATGSASASSSRRSTSPTPSVRGPRPRWLRPGAHPSAVRFPMAAMVSADDDVERACSTRRAICGLFHLVPHPYYDFRCASRATPMWPMRLASWRCRSAGGRRWRRSTTSLPTASRSRHARGVRLPAGGLLRDRRRGHLPPAAGRVGRHRRPLPDAVARLRRPLRALPSRGRCRPDRARPGRATSAGRWAGSARSSQN